MRDLHQRLPFANPLLVLSALLTVVCLMQIRALGSPYADPVANLVLQLAATRENFVAALEAFAADPVRLSAYQWWDTLLPAAYALFLALLVGLLSRILLAIPALGLARLGALLSLLLPLTAVFDWIENQLLLAAFAHEPAAIEYYLAAGRHYAAAPKYLLLSMAAAWLLFASVVLIAGRGAAATANKPDQ